MFSGDFAVDSMLSRITVTPGTRSGQPCIRDLRITVRDILKWLGTGASHAQILSDYPELIEEDIPAALQWASTLKDNLAVPHAQCSCFSKIKNRNLKLENGKSGPTLSHLESVGHLDCEDSLVFEVRHSPK